MRAWNRSTKECTLANIDAESTLEIQSHVSTYNLGPVLEQAEMCIETTSTLIKKGLFGGKKNKFVVSYAILTPRWLILAIRNEKSTIGILSAQLKDMTLTDYATTPDYQLIQDSGLQITAKFTDRVGLNGKERINYFLGLGDEPAGLKFKTMIDAAIQDAKRLATG